MIASLLPEFSVYSRFGRFLSMSNLKEKLKSRFWMETKRIKKNYKVDMSLFSEDFLRLGDIKSKICY